MREKDIIDYCKQSIPENHMPVFRMQADIHEEYMTGIFSLDASGFEIQTLSLFLKCTDNAL